MSRVPAPQRAGLRGRRCARKRPSEALALPQPALRGRLVLSAQLVVADPGSPPLSAPPVSPPPRSRGERRSSPELRRLIGNRLTQIEAVLVLKEILDRLTDAALRRQLVSPPP